MHQAAVLHAISPISMKLGQWSIPVVEIWVTPIDNPLSPLFFLVTWSSVTCFRKSRVTLGWMGQTWVTSCGTQVPWHLPAFFFVPRIILAQPIKAYFGSSLRKQPSLCEASWAAVFAVWSWAPWLGVMWREWWRKSFFENHSLHDPQRVLCLGSPFFIDYVVNFRAQYTVIKSAL